MSMSGGVQAVSRLADVGAASGPITVPYVNLLVWSTASGLLNRHPDQEGRGRHRERPAADRALISRRRNPARPETRAGPARRRHRDSCRHDRSAQRPGNARAADRPDVAVRRRWRGGAAPAITDVFGSRGVAQRCQVHKCRNVLGHLPERLHASVSKALRDAWNLDSADRRPALR